MVSEKKMMVSPSILAANLADIRTETQKLRQAGSDLIHIDVMDGHFVPNITFGLKFCQDMVAITDLPLDIHLMVSEPQFWVPQFFELNPFAIVFHHEATALPVRLLQQITEQGIKAGIAINPSTPVLAVTELLPFLDLVLVMTVEPGFYGQKFIPSVAKKICYLAEMKQKNFPDLLISVDGGVNRENSPLLQGYGADILVAGGFVFQGDDYSEAISGLR